MVEPITIGSFVAGAVSAGAAAIAKGALGVAGKDAYEKLKQSIARITGNSAALTENEANANSEDIQRPLAVTIDGQEVSVQQDLAALATTLIEALQRTEQQDGPIGVDLGRLEAMGVDLGRIQVSEGTGLRAAEVKTTKTFRIGEITAGTKPGKK